MFSRTVRPPNAWLCWNVRASPRRPRRNAGQRVTSRSSRSTRPRVGRSKPLRTFTSVDFPAPFGPISPTTSPCRSSSETSRSATMPANERETEEARSDPPGLPSVSVCETAVKRLRRIRAVRDLLRADQALGDRDVLVDLEHAVGAAEHRVQALREAHLARDRRHLVELLHHCRELRADERAMRALDRDGKTVDRRRALDEAARGS